MSSATPVPLPEFNLKTHKGDTLSKDVLKGDFTLLYLGSLANADHTRASLDHMVHIVQQQGEQLIPRSHHTHWQGS